MTTVFRKGFNILSNGVTNQYLKINMQATLKYLSTTAIKNHNLKDKYRAPTLMEMKRRVDYLKEKGRYPINQRSKYIEWNHDAELYAFGKRLNENFDSALLLEAFTDPSYIFKETQRLKDVGVDDPKFDMKSNKEMSHAGRKLIEDFCTKYLRAVCPLVPEEGIGSLVNYLISDEVLARVAQGLGFRDLILAEEFPPSEKTFAQCFSAVVGCLNVSSGLDRCHLFVRDFVIIQLVGRDLWDIWEVDDPFQLLASILARNGRGAPEPRIMGDIGKGTIESVYEIGIYDSNKTLVGKGYGESTDMAIKVAAYDSLSKLFEQTASRHPMPFDQSDLSLPSKIDPNPSIHEWKIKNSEYILAP